MFIYLPLQKGLTFHLNKFYFLFTKDPVVLKKTKLSDRQIDNIHTLSGKNSAHVTLNQIITDFPNISMDISLLYQLLVWIRKYV